MPSIEEVRRRAAGRRPVMDMFDWDGCIYDTMQLHGQLAADVMNKYFGTPIKEAELAYHSTTGIPFDRQLEIIYPHKAPEVRAACAVEYHTRKVDEVYRDPRPFDDVRPALERLRELGHTLFISSSTEAPLIRELHRRDNLTDYFADILGKHEGSKPQHLARVRKTTNPDLIVFIGDSRNDVALKTGGADLTIGRAGPASSGMLSLQQLLEAGADWATDDLRELSQLFE